MVVVFGAVSLVRLVYYCHLVSGSILEPERNVILSCRIEVQTQTGRKRNPMHPTSGLSARGLDDDRSDVEVLLK